MPSVNTELFELKRNDRDPALEYRAFPSSLDFTGATAVFNMRDKATKTVKVNRGTAQALMIDGKPVLRYLWQLGDTDTDGDFEAEFEVTYSSGLPGTFPNRRDEFIDVVIGEDIS